MAHFIDEVAMIPPKNHPKWSALVKGDIKVQFNVFAGNMMLSQCQRKIARDPSPQSVNACIEEIHSFFSKYENIYSKELSSVF